MADLIDRLLAKALKAVDSTISSLAGGAEAAAKRASGASKSLKRASSKTRERAASAAGEDSGAWDAGAAAAARHYERRASMEALLLCVVAGFLLRILYMNTGFVLQALSPAKYAFADPSAAPLAVWEWLFGTGPRAARAAGGQMITLPPIRGVVPRLLSAMVAALPSVEHSIIMTLILGAGFAAYRYGFDVLTEVSGPREAEMIRAELRKRVAALKAALKAGGGK